MVKWRFSAKLADSSSIGLLCKTDYLCFRHLTKLQTITWHIKEPILMTNTQKIRQLYGLDKATNFGFAENEISELESRLKIVLPQKLKNYYLTLGKNESINHSYNRLLTLEKEIDFSDDRYLMIFEENQAVVSWGIKEEDLTLNNPPVWGNSGTKETPDWYLETKSTDDFFLLMSVYNGTFGGLKYNANYFGEVEPIIPKLIEENWRIVPEISYEKQQVYTKDFYEVISLSFDEDNRCSAIFIGTSIQERFDRILDKIGIDWSYTSYEDENCEEESDSG